MLAGTCARQNRPQPLPAVCRPSQPISGTSSIHNQKLARYHVASRPQFAACPSLRSDNPALKAYDRPNSVQKPKAKARGLKREEALESDMTGRSVHAQSSKEKPSPSRSTRGRESFRPLVTGSRSLIPATMPLITKSRRTRGVLRTFARTEHPPVPEVIC